MLYPLTFRPIFKERVWGGRRLADLYGKPLPPGKPIGESWEIADRNEGVSTVANGPFAGQDLRWLMNHHGAEILGRAPAANERFPWLIKILDCEDDLSLQVHPPAQVATTLGGEPKTEAWFVAHSRPDSKLCVGLRRETTRSEFESALAGGTVADCVHVVNVTPGDSMFVPSGRVHAIGRGNVIFEIQQNSDTTYRVFDWNRLGLDGKPRELHLEESLASIDFADHEPTLVSAHWESVGTVTARRLVEHPFFNISHFRLSTEPNVHVLPETGGPSVIGVINHEVTVISESGSVRLVAGQFALLPASLGSFDVKGDQKAEFLLVSSQRNESQYP